MARCGVRASLEDGVELTPDALDGTPYCSTYWGNYRSHEEQLGRKRKRKLASLKMRQGGCAVAEGKEGK